MAFWEPHKTRKKSYGFLFTISHLYLTASFLSHNSYSAPSVPNVRPMDGLQEVWECPEIACKIVFVYMFLGGSSGLKRRSRPQSKIILSKVPLQHLSIVQEAGARSSFYAQVNECAVKTKLKNINVYLNIITSSSIARWVMFLIWSRVPS